MSFATAAARCEEIGKVLCDYRRMVDGDKECPDSSFHWSNEECNNQKVKVAPDGKGSLVQDWDELDTDHVVRNDTVSFFPLFWDGNEYPTLANGCGNEASCQAFEEYCLCDVTSTLR